MKYNNVQLNAIARSFQYLLLMGLVGCADSSNSSNNDFGINNTHKASPDIYELLELHNRARARGIRCGTTSKVKAQPLAWSKALSRIAESHAADMAKNSKLSHRGSKGSDLTGRIERVGYRWKSSAENIAYGYFSTESVMQAWLDSKPHCRNIANDQVTEMAAAFVNGYWVTVFAKPINN